MRCLNDSEVTARKRRKNVAETSQKRRKNRAVQAQFAVSAGRALPAPRALCKGSRLGAAFVLPRHRLFTTRQPTRLGSVGSL